MNLFPHEEIEQIKKDAEKKILNLKTQLSKLNLFYDICEFAKDYNFIGDYYEGYILLSAPKDLTLFQLHDFLDDLEEDLLFGWKFDEKRSGINTNRQEYYYTHPEKDFTLDIDIVSAYCQIIQTGRMIPETKQICSFNL